MMANGDRGGIEIKANGRFERWVMGIVATLVGVGVVAMIVLAIQVGTLVNDMVWIKAALGRVELKTDNNDKRLDQVERRGHLE